MAEAFAHGVGVIAEVAIEFGHARSLVDRAKALVTPVEMDADETARGKHFRNVGVTHPLLQRRSGRFRTVECHFVVYHKVAIVASKAKARIIQGK